MPSAVSFSHIVSSSVVPGSAIYQYVPMHTFVLLYHGSLGSCHGMLIIEQYRALPPNYRAVQNGIDPSMAGAYLTRLDMDFTRASIDLHEAVL